MRPEVVWKKRPFRINSSVATAKDARATVRKVKRVRKSYARKIQILTVGEQRAKVMGKKTVASIFKSAKAGLRRANNAKKKRSKTKKSRR